MKNITLILFAFFVFIGVQPTFGAIPVATPPASSAASSQSIVHRSEKVSWFSTKVDEIKSMLHPEHRVPDLGKLALIFGICGFIPVIGWMPAIAAIVLGSIGMHKKKDKRAMVGMILGIVSLTLGIIILAAILIALSA